MLVRPGTLVRHALWVCGRCHVSNSCFGFGALHGYIYLLHEKSQAVNALEVYIIEVESQLERNVKIIRLDRGGEYYEKYCELGQYLGPFAKLLEKHDICAQYTIPRIPQQNGVAERQNLT